MDLELSSLMISNTVRITYDITERRFVALNLEGYHNHSSFKGLKAFPVSHYARLKEID